MFEKLMNKHYAIERFGALFLTLVILLGVTTGSIVVRKNSHDKENLTNNVIYTQKISFSRSKATGNVVQIMSNKDQSSVFILLQVEDMTSLPTDASDYSVYLMGSNTSQDITQIKSRPSGTLYAFGNTGYFGIYLVNNEPFPSQILRLILRNNKDLSEGAGTENRNVQTIDDTFNIYDQAQLYFNPGGSAMEKAKFLDSDSIDMSDMYKDAIVKPEEKTIKETLNNDLQSMFNYLRQASNYEEKLTSGQDGKKVQSPDVPEEIAGDAVTAKLEDGTELRFSDTKNGWVDASASEDDVKANPSNYTAYSADKYNLYLSSDTTVPGGYDFDWQTTSADKGWLDDLRGSMSVEDYLNEQAQEQTETKYTLTMPEAWYYDDGTKIETSTENAGDSQVDQLVASDISKLEDVWNQYYTLKVQYETKDLQSLLNLERDSKAMSENYTQNNSDKSFTIVNG